MTEFEFVEPERIIVTLKDGRNRIYALSKMPAAIRDEVMIEYMTDVKERTAEAVAALVQNVLAYVGIVMIDDVARPLSTRALILSHAGDERVQMKLLVAMMLYNIGKVKNIDQIRGVTLVKSALS
jgi:2-C-methyl-D-erythritol 4-phosphate cytidylyltransferase